ncbi:hypothetical protein B5X24_HaOG209460 [Helicoverpa armigera]|uniref:Uncharacterized protein n=1 Tax=Helicoverpa armigera TaxID=29058 RepID=A0A2W1BFF8_HELAM|nr:hypothetical protein B5X24_HaOG209460 [Helicoverpa armigera]
MTNAKYVMPVVLGLSLLSVSAFVVYYVFKKDDEEEGDKRVKTSRVKVIEVEVPKSIVPALIGLRDCSKELPRPWYIKGLRRNSTVFSQQESDTPSAGGVIS